MADRRVIWLWRVSSRPSIVDRQEMTLGKQQSRMDRMQNEIDDLQAHH
jgi:hypothetical protein